MKLLLKVVLAVLALILLLALTRDVELQDDVDTEDMKILAVSPKEFSDLENEVNYSTR